MDIKNSIVQQIRGAFLYPWPVSQLTEVLQKYTHLQTVPISIEVNLRTGKKWPAWRGDLNVEVTLVAGLISYILLNKIMWDYHKVTLSWRGLYMTVIRGSTVLIFNCWNIFYIFWNTRRSFMLTLQCWINVHMKTEITRNFTRSFLKYCVTNLSVADFRV